MHKIKVFLNYELNTDLWWIYVTTMTIAVTTPKMITFGKSKNILEIFLFQLRRIRRHLVDVKKHTRYVRNQPVSLSYPVDIITTIRAHICYPCIHLLPYPLPHFTASRKRHKHTSRLPPVPIPLYKRIPHRTSLS